MESLVDQFFDKIYYINLEEDVERNNSMLSQFEKFNIKNFLRVEGVRINHKEVDPDSYRNFIKFDEKYINGSLGCRKAQLKIINHAVNNNYQRILMLEDDCIFHVDPNQLIRGNINYISEYYDLLYFGGIIEQHFRNQIVCAHAMSFGYGILKDILLMAEASGMEIDNFYAKVIQHMSRNSRLGGQIVTKRIEPFNTIEVNGFHSNIKK